MLLPNSSEVLIGFFSSLHHAASRAKLKTYHHSLVARSFCGAQFCMVHCWTCKQLNTVCKFYKVHYHFPTWAANKDKLASDWKTPNENTFYPSTKTSSDPKAFPWECFRCQYLAQSSGHLHPTSECLCSSLLSNSDTDFLKFTCWEVTSKSLYPRVPATRPRLSSSLLNSAWPSLGQCMHLGNIKMLIWEYIRKYMKTEI